MNKQIMHALIDGKFITNNNKWVEIISPTTNQVIGKVPALDKTHIDQAFQSAYHAQKIWAKQTLLNRINILNGWKKLIITNKKAIADLMMNEIAKGEKAALSEIERSVEYIDYTFEEAKRLHPLSYDGASWNLNHKIAIFEHVPKGVVLAISPFNYPVNLSISKIIPALVTGNAVVFKPASQGSLTGLFLAKLAQEAGIPNGVFNAVSGKGSDIGDNLVTNPLINVISFTGSAQVGKDLAAKSLKTDLILELGGKDPAIVLEDADLQDAAKKIVKGAFSYSGQRCTAIKRVLVIKSIKNKLLTAIKNEIQNLTIGSPFDNCDITPVIDKKTVSHIQSMIADAEKKGAKIVLGNIFNQNLMYPTLVDNVTLDMDIAWDEPFGPILPIISIKDSAEAVTIANKSQYGLQAAIFTNNINEAFSIAKQLETGTVNINDQTQRGPDHFPFMGIKDSGLGVQGIRDSLMSFTRPKGIVFNWNEKK